MLTPEKDNTPKDKLRQIKHRRKGFTATLLEIEEATYTGVKHTFNLEAHIWNESNHITPLNKLDI